MSIVTLTTLITSPKTTLFNYLIDIDNLPEWATEFCHKLTFNNGQYIVTTPMGELFYRVDSDLASGVIDLMTSPDGDQYDALATRVLRVSEHACAYVVSAIQVPAISDEIFKQQMTSLDREMKNLQRLFA